MKQGGNEGTSRFRPGALLARFWAWFFYTPPDATDFDEYCRIKNVRFSQASIVLVAGNLLLWLPTDFWVFPDDRALAWSVVAFRLLFVLFGVAGFVALSLIRANNRHTTVVIFIIYLFLCGFSFAFIGRLIKPDVPLAFTAVAAPIVLVSLLLPLGQRVLLIGSGIVVLIASYYSAHPIEQTFRYNGMAWLFLCVVGLCVAVVGHMLYRLEKANFHQQRSIREHAVRLEELDRMKDAFVTTVSHELRTPLNAIIGLTDVVLDEDLPGEVRQHVRTIHDSGDVLLHLINDILDLAKIRSGKLELDETPMSVRSLVETTAGFFSVACEQKNLTLACHVPADLPLLHADPGRLGQVLLNLLGNAVKFTDAGEISVHVSWKADGDHAALTFRVSDTGPGIPAGSRTLIFDEFTQAEPGTTRRYGGTGLGLPIVRRLVRLMGGDIRVEDNAPRGSTFVVDVRLKLTGTPDPLVRVLPAAATTAWVVCASHPVRRAHAAETLRRVGATVREVVSLDDAARALPELVGERGSVSLLVDDPDLTAEELAQSRAWSVRKQQMPVVLVLGARMLQREGRAFRSMGVDHLLPAPLRTPDLLDALKRISGVAAPAQSAAPTARFDPWLSGSPAFQVGAAALHSAAPDSAPFDGATARNSKARDSAAHDPALQSGPAPKAPATDPRRRLLVVDDVKENRRLIGALLKNLPIDIDYAENGAEGVECFTRATDPYDAVLLDIEMPKLDGYGAVRQMRHWELENDRPATPILALTAHGAPEHRARAAEAGFTSHVTKPIHKRTLIEVLTPYLQLDSTSSAGAQPGSMPRSHLTPAPRSGETVEAFKPSWNASWTTSPEVVQLRPIFLAKVREDLRLLEEWLRSGELEPMAKLGHRLAGAGGSFGFQKISTLGEGLERAAGTGNFEATALLVDELRSELETAA